MAITQYKQAIPKNISELVVYWLVSYASSRKSASSIKRDHGIFKNYLISRFGTFPIGKLSAREFELWLTELVVGKGLSKKSANDILVLLRKVLNDAVRWDFIEKNPLLKVQKFKVNQSEMKFWNPDEVQHFLGAHLERDQENPRIFWPAALALYTGLRRG